MYNTSNRGGDHNLGWIGLLGLVGLTGLVRRSNRISDHDHDRVENNRANQRA